MTPAQSREGSAGPSQTPGTSSDHESDFLNCSKREGRPRGTADDVNWRPVASWPWAAGSAWAPGRELSPEAPETGHSPAGGCPARPWAAEDASPGWRPASSSQAEGPQPRGALKPEAGPAGGSGDGQAPCCSAGVLATPLVLPWGPAPQEGRGGGPGLAQPHRANVRSGATARDPRVQCLLEGACLQGGAEDTAQQTGCAFPQSQRPQSGTDGRCPHPAQRGQRGCLEGIVPREAGAQASRLKIHRPGPEQTSALPRAARQV